MDRDQLEELKDNIRWMVKFLNGIEFNPKSEIESKLRIEALEFEVKDQQEYISRLMSDRLNYTKQYMDEVHKLTQEINRLKNGNKK
jgi:hypothetical protein